VAKLPDEFVIVSLVWLVSLLRTITFAPLTTAPDGSVTVPWMLPVEIVVCANVATAAQNNTAMEMTSKK